MAFVVTEVCIKCKYGDCVEVCPQEAFREGVNFMVIDPKACAHCALCEMVCPVGAIYADYNLPEGQEKFVSLNKELALSWPKAQYRPAPPGADEWAKRGDKLAELDRGAYQS